MKKEKNGSSGEIPHKVFYAHEYMAKIAPIDMQKEIPCFLFEKLPYQGIVNKAEHRDSP